MKGDVKMQKMKTLRKKNGISQQEMAEILNTTQATIHNYECGTHEPTIENLAKIAIIFNTTVDELIEFKKIHDQIGQELKEKIQKVKEPK